MAFMGGDAGITWNPVEVPNSLSAPGIRGQCTAGESQHIFTAAYRVAMPGFQSSVGSHGAATPDSLPSQPFPRGPEGREADQDEREDTLSYMDAAYKEVRAEKQSLRSNKEELMLKMLQYSHRLALEEAPPPPPSLEKSGDLAL
jgi:hypothetical protein